MKPIMTFVKGALTKYGALLNSNSPGGTMVFLEQLTSAFTSHLTMIILSITAVAIAQAALDAYTSSVRETAKAVHKFSYTSPVGETISVESARPLEVLHLRGLINTCNAQAPQQRINPTQLKNPRDRGVS